MGLFSSDYVTTVGTTVSRVIKDDLIVPSTKIGVTNGIFSQDSSQLVENVMESILGGMGIRGERMYTYAKEHYTFGLPNSKVSTSADGQNVVMGIIWESVPEASKIYYHVGAINYVHVGWKMMVDTQGYDSSTNKLTALTTEKGHDVFLKNLVVVIKDSAYYVSDKGSLEQWDTSASLGVTPERTALTELSSIYLANSLRRATFALHDIAVEIEYVWVVPTRKIITPASTEVVNGVPVVTPEAFIMEDVITKETRVFPIEGYSLTHDFVHVKYSDGIKNAYFLYELGTNGSAEIEAIFNVNPNAAGEFFPFTYFRHGSVSMGADKNTEAYKTSNKMLKKLGINYQDIITAVNENPDIAKVDQALLMFGVPANTDDPVEVHYLFDFFTKLYISSGGVDVGWDVGNIETLDTNNIIGGLGLSPEYLLAELVGGSGKTARISVSIEDSRLSTALSCASISRTTHVGKVTKVGEYTHTSTKESVTYTYSTRQMTGTELTPRGEKIPVYEDVSHPYTVETDVLILQKQTSLNSYKEVKVYDLKMTFFMWGGYSTIANDFAPFLLVPLDHSITQHYGVLERESLYSTSMHFVFNAREVTEVRWYQQAWFGAIVQVVGIVLTVMSLGEDGGFFATMADTIVEVGVMGLVVISAMDLVINMLVLEALKLFVKAVGWDASFLVAIIAMAYAGYSSFKAGSLKGAPWAKELLSIGNGLMTTVNKSVTDSLQLLSKESDEFNLLLKESWKTLEEVKKSMTQQDILSPRLIYGQTPDELYKATYAGNIGVSGGIDSITSYVDIALTLPKLNDTLGGNEYGNTV